MNPLHHRLHNRCWNLISSRLTDNNSVTLQAPFDGAASSVSSTMPWAAAAQAHADPAVSSARFRRLRAVRDVVETVGPVDGRCYANKIRTWAPDWFHDPQISRLDSWGTPIRWPAVLLGTPRPFSPTTLRYLATALWLKREGLVTRQSHIVEVGVGFGGLAAANAVVSGTGTLLIDLPQVESLAKRMLTELDLGDHGQTSASANLMTDWCFISNYAFTELSAQTQDEYLEKWIRPASRGVIVSNAGMFSQSIGGRSDAELVSMLKNAGVPAKIDSACDLFTPADGLCKVTLIHWNRSKAK